MAEEAEVGTQVPDSLLTALWNQMDLSWVAILKIGLICVLCWLILGLVKRVRNRIAARVEASEESGKINRSSASVLLTLVPIGASIAKGLVIFFTVLMCLAVLNVSVSPFVYLLGFASMGISLGAQDTFSDIIRGVLTLVEGKISLGDLLCINGAVGHAQELGIRQLTLRHLDGSIEDFPYSKVETIRNFSVGPTTMESVFKISSGSDIVAFEKIAKDVFMDMRHSEDWKSYFIDESQEAPEVEFCGVENSGLSLKISITTRCDPDGCFVNEFNRRMIKPLQEAGMLIAPSGK